MEEVQHQLISKENNFNFIRIFSAFVVLISHFSILTATNHFFPISAATGVKIFFIISGFLIMLSYMRTPDNKVFFLKRLHRIMPAYVIIVIICALGGAFITTLSAKEYFTSHQLYTYLIGNLLTLNSIEPCLPGVFETNFIHAVNGSLWTIKVELMLYLTVPLVYKLLTKYNKLAVLIIIYILSSVYSYGLEYLYGLTGHGMLKTLSKQFPGQMMYFYSPVILLVYFKTFLKYKNYILIFSVIFLVFLESYPVLEYIEPLVLSACIVGFAYSFNWLSIIRKLGDSSYGIYLCHFPIIQLFIQLGFDKYSLPLMFIVTITLCTIIGMASWKYIEKPNLYRPAK
ncbi:MAG: acyltransferase family protein [Dysgonomonas sp.]